MRRRDLPATLRQPIQEAHFHTDFPMAPLVGFVFYVLNAILSLLVFALIANAILSWLVAFDVINLRNQFVYNVARFLDAVTRLRQAQRRGRLLGALVAELGRRVADHLGIGDQIGVQAAIEVVLLFCIASRQGQETGEHRPRLQSHAPKTLQTSAPRRPAY